MMPTQQSDAMAKDRYLVVGWGFALEAGWHA